ncbi:MAG: hypothetical protein V4525_13175 [Pseudomonadota bacterium]
MARNGRETKKPKQEKKVEIPAVPTGTNVPPTSKKSATPASAGQRK